MGDDNFYLDEVEAVSKSASLFAGGTDAPKNNGLQPGQVATTEEEDCDDEGEDEDDFDQNELDQDMDAKQTPPEGRDSTNGTAGREFTRGP